VGARVWTPVCFRMCGVGTVLCLLVQRLLTSRLVQQCGTAVLAQLVCGSVRACMSAFVGARVCARTPVCFHVLFLRGLARVPANIFNHMFGATV